MRKKKNIKIEMPFYCKECGQCETNSEAFDNLKIKNNTGWTHDVFCLKRKAIVYRI